MLTATKGNYIFICQNVLNGEETESVRTLLLLPCCPVLQKALLSLFFFFNPILFAICTNTFSKLCQQRIKQHVEECSVALLCK
jgi:hypothetical protein